VGIGASFAYFYGWDKIVGGLKDPKVWGDLGKSMSYLGVTFLPEFWGFMCAFAEFAGGICLALGLFFRPMAAIMTFNMAVATLVLYHSGGKGISHPAELGVITLALVISGPGQFALGRVFFGGGTKKTKKSAA
jgi:putative oxidoreductase